jgi:hypothetical protein
MEIIVALITLVVLNFHFNSEQESFQIVRFLNHFENDSIDAFVNKKLIGSAKLNTNPSTGQCDYLILIKMENEVQCLKIIEAFGKRNFSTVLKKGFKYCYVYKQDTSYRFEYSNKLILGE